MNHKRLAASYRLLLAVIIFIVFSVQFYESIIYGGYGVVNFFSFFTLQSTLLAGVVMAISAVKILRGRPQNILHSLRGMATLYAIISGVVYAVLLSSLPDTLQPYIPWVNNTMHYLIPTALLVDWLAFPGEKRIYFNKALRWLVYPLLFSVYTLVRGGFTGWYPYPFINPAVSDLSYILFINCSIAAGGVLLIWLLARTSSGVKAVAGQVNSLK